MTAAEILFNLLLIAVVWGSLNWQNLRTCRRDRDLYRADAAHNFDVAQAAQARIDRAEKASLAALVAQRQAEAYAADMSAQRTDMQRRLATATLPKLEVYK